MVGFRSRGLWAGVDVDPALGTGREISERLMREGILVKDTHGSTIVWPRPDRHGGGAAERPAHVEKVLARAPEPPSPGR
ncbi:hypothetical protein GCM10023238_23650 [Streptomyces heliomycini]